MNETIPYIPLTITELDYIIETIETEKKELIKENDDDLNQVEDEYMK